MQRRSASDGRVCFVWVVEHGDAFIRVSSYMVRHCLGEKKKKSLRLKYWALFNSDIPGRLKDRPPKPSIQSRDFPKECTLFKAIQSQSPSLHCSISCVVVL